jgi:type IV secretion system protein VirB10
MFVTFHRAVCPDGFSLDFDKYIGLDPLGTTGLATKVNHGYLMAFGAATAIGGLGGLAQIGNNSSVLDSSTQIRNGISEQTAAEGEQVLNHFLTGVNRQWITHSVDVQTPIRSTENETNRFELLDPAASGS